MKAQTIIIVVIAMTITPSTILNKGFIYDFILLWVLVI